MAEKIAGGKRKRKKSGGIPPASTSESAGERSVIEALLQDREARLEKELANIKLLHAISSEIIHEESLENLYQKLLDGAVAIMCSDFASMQMLYPERGSGGELRLLASRGFSAEAAKFWEWVRADSGCSCGKALVTGARVTVPDVEQCDFIGEEDLAIFLQTGIHAVQTTPLFSRGGKMVGMISTHWRRPHRPSEQDLRLFDILARQAADLIERRQAEEALRTSEAHYRNIFQATSVSIWEEDFSAVKRALDELKATGVWDLRHYFDRHPEFVQQAIDSVRIVDVNDATLRMFGAKDKQELAGSLGVVFLPETAAVFVEELLAIAKGRTFFEADAMLRTIHGRRLHALVTISFPPPGGDFQRVLVSMMDITGRKRAEQALRESEARFRNMADHAPVMVWITEPDGSASYLSASWYEFTGQTPQTALGFGWVEAVHPQDRGRAHDIFVAANAKQETFRLEYRLLRKDGTYRWAIDAAAPRFSDAGVFLGYIGSVIDITERKQAEEALARVSAASEQERRLYHTILSNTPDLVYVFDLDHRFTYANDALLAMWGRTRDEAIGKNCLELGYEPWHAAMHDREIEQVIATRQAIRGEVPFNGTNGRRIYDYIFVPVLNAKGEVEAIAGTTRDVTERKQSEEALRQSEERLRAVFNSAAVGVALLAPDARFLQVNETFCSITGYSAAELCALDCTAITHPDDVPRMQALLGDLQAGRTAGFVIEKRSYRKDGALIWVQCSISVARDHAGTASHLVVLCQDITERKHAQEALKADARRKDEFLATLSHELRNPLAPIRQAAKLLKSPQLDEHEAQWAREVIDRQVRAMGLLLDDLLDISRISSGKLELRKEPVELASVVESALELSRPLIEAKRHKLHIQLPETAVWLEADPLRLAQIISNLLTNAAKYTGPQGDISLWAEREKQELVVCVSDNGIGISADILPKVFDMFSQAAPPLDRTEGGLGVGLALVRGFVGLHGGSVHARSEGHGRGSTFTLRLPLGTVSFGAKAHPATTDVQPARGRKVLVVDDNRDAAETLAAFVRLQGYEVKTAFNGREALEISEIFHPDIALLDIGMPGLNGYEIAQHIRERLWGRRMILVAVTGWGQEDDRRRALAAGFDYHLRKPIDLDSLHSLFSETQPGTQHS